MLEIIVVCWWYLCTIYFLWTVYEIFWNLSSLVIVSIILALTTLLSSSQEIHSSSYSYSLLEGGGAISLTPLPVLLLLCLFHYSSAEVICSEMARGYGEVFKLRRSGHACNSERALIAPALRSVI